MGMRAGLRDYNDPWYAAWVRNNTGTANYLGPIELLYALNKVLTHTHPTSTSRTQLPNTPNQTCVFCAADLRLRPGHVRPLRLARL
jgi:hypothetical protein